MHTGQQEVGTADGEPHQNWPPPQEKVGGGSKQKLGPKTAPEADKISANGTDDLSENLHQIWL